MNRQNTQKFKLLNIFLGAIDTPNMLCYMRDSSYLNTLNYINLISLHVFQLHFLFQYN